jgi:hypothetical protein
VIPVLWPKPNKGALGYRTGGAWTKGKRNREERVARARLELGIPGKTKEQAHRRGRWADSTSGR